MPDLPRIALASASPRRRQLLKQMGAEFIVIEPSIEERQLPGEGPAELVERLALEKALAVRNQADGRIILGSDTIVVLGDRILGKPESPAQAREMLGFLSGNTHTVFTGFALVEPGTGRQHISHERTDVTFRALDAEEIDRYVASGSPLDKAGSYGIQDDFGAVFIERIAGDYYTVVGLPLARVYVALRAMGRDGD